jgi:hypothetical protein
VYVLVRRLWWSCLNIHEELNASLNELTFDAINLRIN